MLCMPAKDVEGAFESYQSKVEKSMFMPRF